MIQPTHYEREVLSFTALPSMPSSTRLFKQYTIIYSAQIDSSSLEFYMLLVEILWEAPAPVSFRPRSYWKSGVTLSSLFRHTCISTVRVHPWISLILLLYLGTINREIQFSFGCWLYSNWNSWCSIGSILSQWLFFNYCQLGFDVIT